MAAQRFDSDGKRLPALPVIPKPGWKEAFLAGLRISANTSLAAEHAQITRQLAYNERKRNPEFAAAWEEALEEAVDALAQEAHRRAVEGVEKIVYYQGEEVGRERVYSDTLLIYLLKIHGGPKWRQDRHVTMEGAIDVTGRIDISTIDALLAEEGIALPAHTQAVVAYIEEADTRELPDNPDDDDYAEEMIG